MAASYKFFEEDAVYRTNRKGEREFGLVLENSEYVSSDEEENDYEDNFVVKKGFIRVSWYPKGNEEVVPENKVKLADRSVMPGDIVRRISGKDIQRGYCRVVTVTADIHILGTKLGIKHVSSQDLIPLEELCEYTVIVLGPWVGVIRQSNIDVTLRCRGGSRCVLTGEQAYDLDDLRDKRNRDSEFTAGEFYVGQQLWGTMFCFEHARWLSITKGMAAARKNDNKKVYAVVEEVQLVSLDVHWQCRSFSKDDRELKDIMISPPSHIIEGDDLKRVKVLNAFEAARLQLGDRNYVVIKDKDTIVPLKSLLTHKPKAPVAESSSQATETEMPNGVPSSEADTNLGAIRDSDRNAVMADGDAAESGSDSDYEDDEDSDAASVNSATSQNSNKKKSKKHTVRALLTKSLKNKKLRRAKGREQEEEVEEVSVTPGVRVCVESLRSYSTAELVWQDGSVEKDIPSAMLYPILHLDDHEFFPGDFVVDAKETNTRMYGVVQSVDHQGRTAIVQWMRTYIPSVSQEPECVSQTTVSVYDLKDHPDFRFRHGSFVIRIANIPENSGCDAGQVLDNQPSGQVLIRWADGNVSTCWPQDIYKFGPDDDSDGGWGDGDSEDGSSDDSWETESEKSFTGQENDDPAVVAGVVTQLAANIETARAAMSRLEEIFIQNPTLQSNSIIRQILDVYRECRHMDRLMSTAFFHESHFDGLIAELKVKARQHAASRVAQDVLHMLNNHGTVTGARTADPDTGSAEAPAGTPAAARVATTDSEPRDDSAAGVEGRARTDEQNAGIVENDSQPVSQVVSGGGWEEGRQRVSNGSVCARLFALLRQQLLKAHEEVTKRFGVIGDALLKEEDEEGVAEKTKDGGVEKDAPAETQESEAEVSSSQVSSSRCEEFTMLEMVPDTHKFKLSVFQPVDSRNFFSAVRRELKLLQHLPEGILVRGFENRMDLFSAMIKGPIRTPYEDGLFHFDIQLSNDYPRTPPVFHYISYCSDRLNPNLYEDGKVCVSLLGTWSGKGTEVWTSKSNLLQVLVSIQGLILVNEPYYNEAGYEKQRGTQQGAENSRMYNEMAVLKLIQSMNRLLNNPSIAFRDEIVEHFRGRALKMIERFDKWLKISQAWSSRIADLTSPASPSLESSFLSDLMQSQAGKPGGRCDSTSESWSMPDFPLLPASRGFCITLERHLQEFKETWERVGSAGAQIPSAR